VKRKNFVEIYFVDVVSLSKFPCARYRIFIGNSLTVLTHNQDSPCCEEKTSDGGKTMSIEEKASHLRNSLPATGTFISVPEAFPGVDEGLVHAFKMGFQAIPSKKRSQSFLLDNESFVDVALIDFGAVSLSAFDFKKMARDCELLGEAFLNHPDEVLKIVAAFQLTAPLTSAAQAVKIAEEIGITEEMVIQKGGGFVPVLIAIAAVLLAAGCEHCQQPITQPARYPQAPDAGTGDQ